MALTLHKIQLNYSGVMQWWASGSLIPTPFSYDSWCVFLMWLLTSDILGRWCSETVTASVATLLFRKYY